MICPHCHAPVELISAEDVAQRLGRSRRTIAQLAATHGVGAMVGHTLVFTTADIPALTVRKPGRPAMEKSHS